MAVRVSEEFQVSPEDPRAPSHSLWLRMSPAQRAAVVEALPSDFDLDAGPPEGDRHLRAAITARLTLESHFRRLGRKVYLSSNLAVYYPGERVFAPDVFAVCDVEPHDREKWIVDLEGKGLDFVLEVHVSGNRAKDEVRNLEWYARLGIAEYFVFDRARRTLRGHRLAPKGSIYAPIAPREGRLDSRVLDLDLTLEGDRLRFYHGAAAVLEADELIGRLGTALNDAIARKEEMQRVADEEAARARTEAERARAEAERASRLEYEIVQLRAELDRLRRR